MRKIWINRALIKKPSQERRSNDGPCRIDVLPDRKIRTLWFGDEWPILYRREVPNLTDAEWYASPGPEWTELVEQQ